jgi:hypothetical protein
MSPDDAQRAAKSAPHPAAERAFVIQLSPDCDPGSGKLSGRVQHLRTADGGNFDSVEALLVLLWRVLERTRQEVSDEPDGR